MGEAADILARLEMLKIAKEDLIVLHFRELRSWLETAPEEVLRAFSEEFFAFEQRLGSPLVDKIQQGDPEEIQRAYALAYYTLGLGMAYQLGHGKAQG